MKMKKLMLIAAATCAAVLSAFAAAKVPSEADVRAEGKYLTELTRGDVSQMRQRKITKEQYADALADYAADEKKPAADYCRGVARGQGRIRWTGCRRECLAGRM